MPTKVKIDIEDNKELRLILDTIYDMKTPIQVVKYGILLAQHIQELTDTPSNQMITNGYLINEAWQNRKAKMRDVRKASFQIHELAKNSKDPLLQAVYRVIGHGIASAHVKEHAMVASDYAILAINHLHPNDLKEVIKERKFQIELLGKIE